MAKKLPYKELEDRLKASEKQVACLKRVNEEAQRLLVELERRNEKLERVARTASRDLQEALDGVSRYLQFVEARYKGRLDADANEFIESAVDGANRMHQVINSLLAYFSNQNPSKF
jgi:light-regulated signal transduction histidine kinase (bacteriophytochrome)